MAGEGIPTGEHPPRSILMGGATGGSPGVPRDVRKLIFPTIATPWDPWINRGYSQSHQEAHSQKGWVWESSPGHIRGLGEGKTPLRAEGGLEGGFPLPLTNFPPFPELRRNSFTNLIRTVGVLPSARCNRHLVQAISIS